jgi:hypothetical protein
LELDGLSAELFPLKSLRDGMFPSKVCLYSWCPGNWVASLVEFGSRQIEWLLEEEGSSESAFGTGGGVEGRDSDVFISEATVTMSGALEDLACTRWWNSNGNNH